MHMFLVDSYVKVVFNLHNNVYVYLDQCGESN